MSEKIKKMVFVYETASIRVEHNFTPKKYFKMKLQTDNGYTTYYVKKSEGTNDKVYIEKHYSAAGVRTEMLRPSEMELGSKMLDAIERCINNGHRNVRFSFKETDEDHRISPHRVRVKENYTKMMSVYDVLKNNNVVDIFPGIKNNDINGRYSEIRHRARSLAEESPITYFTQLRIKNLLYVPLNFFRSITNFGGGQKGRG